jgi:CheY-like chemotaxis protein
MATTRPTVLIVDDDSAIRRMFIEILSLESYPHWMASDGVQGLKLMRGSPAMHLPEKHLYASWHTSRHSRRPQRVR